MNGSQWVTITDGTNSYHKKMEVLPKKGVVTNFRGELHKVKGIETVNRRTIITVEPSIIMKGRKGE